MKLWKKIIIGLVLLFVVIQFIPTNRKVTATTTANDFIYIEKPPTEIATIIKNTCYDCHSYETKYPWYSNVAPVSWWIDHHINEAREHLNFSTWASNNEKNEAREESAEEIAEGKMPVQSYVIMHSEAKLSKKEKQALVDWFNQNAPEHSSRVSTKHEEDEDDEDD